MAKPLNRCPAYAKRRSQTGSVLFLAIAVTVLVGGVLTLFGLGYLRTLGQYHQQVTAMEAASLAAANAVSRIVVDDPYFGYISLSDYPPNHKGTKAGDNFFLPVTGINTLVATVRLDEIVVDKLNDPTMKSCADRDYTNMLASKDKLLAILKASLDDTAPSYDVDGNQIKPLEDAILAYNSNRIDMNGSPSNLVPGSMKLKLGCIRNLRTTTHIPNPPQFAEVQPDQQDSSFYKACVNVPFKEKDFVFGATAEAARLVDAKSWEDDITDLPYSIPTIIRCEADQKTKDISGSGGNKEATVHTVVCAEPGSAEDRRPAPGALAVTFPAGSPADVGSLLNILTNAAIAKNPTDCMRTPPDGDYPATNLTRLKLDFANRNNPPIGQVVRLAVYDWIRKAGAHVNIQSLIDCFKLPIAADVTPHSVLYKFDLAGNVIQDTMAITPSPTLPVSNRQIYAVSGLCFTSSDTRRFDLYVRDFCYKLGRTNGGIHAGEPVSIPFGAPLKANPTGWPDGGLSEDPATMGTFITGPGNGATRPTYETVGIAAEVKFRPRPASADGLGTNVNDSGSYAGR